MAHTHTYADILAGENHPLFPWNYRYAFYCYKCGFVEWVATEKPH